MLFGQCFEGFETFPLQSRVGPECLRLVVAPAVDGVRPRMVTSQLLISMENEMAQFQSQTLTKSSKRGGAEVAEQIAGFSAVSSRWGQSSHGNIR